jgi:Spy/CpxP family protein refolding chaperone
MRKNVVKIMVLLFIMCGFTVPGFAQPPEPGGPGSLNKPPTAQQQDTVRKRIESMKMWKLTKDLDLDEATSAKLFPIINKYDKKKADIYENLRTRMQEIKTSLDDKKTDQLKDLIVKVEENRKALQGVTDEEWAEVKRVLTIEQQAKFILSRQEFGRQMRGLIEDSKDKQPGQYEMGRGSKSRRR